jgi:peptidoglycan/xylan/chitin deacetylase (PgdA/CDA1 family)
MRKIIYVVIIILIGILFVIFFDAKNQKIVFDYGNDKIDTAQLESASNNYNQVSDYEKTKNKISEEYKNSTPHVWSERAPGVVTKLDTGEKVLALTFDACGGDGKNGYDADLINYLTEEKIPATLFIGGQWIANNRDVFQHLAENSLFEIENHGTKHIPCSVSGKSAYNIQGENNPGEVVDEIEKNAEKIGSITGRKPKFYRAGTTFTDEICPQIAGVLGYKIVSYSVLGDAGATYSKDQIKSALMKAPAGSIVLLHMNHPEKETAEGIMSVIPELQKEGFRFVKLEDYNLK